MVAAVAEILLTIWVGLTLGSDINNISLILDVSNTHLTAGLISLNYRGKWAHICHYGDQKNWGKREGDTACKQLQFAGGWPYDIDEGKYGSHVQNLNNFDCDETDVDLNYCEYEIADECENLKLAGIQCYRSFEVQLVGGISSNVGRVEVRYDNEWTSVCYETSDGSANDWSFANAQVVCRELGFPGTMFARQGGQGQGTREHVINGYQCREDLRERSLHNCYPDHPKLRVRDDSNSSCGTGHSSVSNEAVTICAVPGYVGCYDEDVISTNLETLTLSNMTINACRRYCRKHIYLYAFLHKGDSCVCGSLVPDIRLGDIACSIECSGDANQVCGNKAASSVYDVTVGTCTDPSKRTDDVYYFGEIYAIQCDQGMEPVNGTAIQCVLKTFANKFVWNDTRIPACKVLGIEDEDVAYDYKFGNVGCYNEDITSTNLETLILPNMTINTCRHYCRKSIYKYAFLYKGDSCVCGNIVPDIRLEGTACNIKCSGGANQTCGGITTFSVYDVTVGTCTDQSKRKEDVYYFGEIYAIQCDQGMEPVNGTAFQCVMGTSPDNFVWNDTRIPECKASGIEDDVVANNSNLGLPIGVPVGCVCLSAIIILVGLLLYWKRKRSSSAKARKDVGQQNDSEPEPDENSEVEPVDQTIDDSQFLIEERQGISIKITMPTGVEIEVKEVSQKCSDISRKEEKKADSTADQEKEDKDEQRPNLTLHDINPEVTLLNEHEQKRFDSDNDRKKIKTKGERLQSKTPSHIVICDKDGYESVPLKETSIDETSNNETSNKKMNDTIANLSTNSTDPIGPCIDDNQTEAGTSVECKPTDTADDDIDVLARGIAKLDLNERVKENPYPNEMGLNAGVKENPYRNLIKPSKFQR
ncbi:uncharacterized protein [Amphiura filiformis]|uniref:uncharacterized protein n=1 Tax=Amphiura filiformis TaxID=82378 RepID=UPI003B222B11